MKSILWETAELCRALEEQARKRTPCPHCSNPDTRMFGCFCELHTEPKQDLQNILHLP